MVGVIDAGGYGAPVDGGVYVFNAFNNSFNSEEGAHENN